jgi:hypothetical protein
MIVDNHNIPESEVSVKKLYKTRVMMKWVEIIGMN